MSEDYKAITVATPSAIQDNAPIWSLYQEWDAHLQRLVDASDLSPFTRSSYLRSVEIFLTWCRVSGVAEVTSATVLDWKASLGKNGSTVNVMLSGVRQFFAWAVGARRLAYNPTEGVKGAKRKGTTRRHSRNTLTPYEIKRILSKPRRDKPQGKRDYAILMLFVYTALRTIEIHRADLADIQTQGGKLTLFVQGKGRHEKDDFVVIAHPEAQRALYEWLSTRGGKAGALFSSVSNRSYGERLSLRAIRDMVKGYYAAAGIHDAKKTTHSLRHTAITTAIQNNAPIQKVQSMARHESVNTTMRYYHELDRLDDPAEAYIDYDA